MDKQIINKAFADAEKEQQEKEIGKIKNIITSYLTKISDKKLKRKELDDEIKILSKDLDDLKSGRLDKIHERNDKDEKARDVSIIIVKKIEKEYIPYYPWRSLWYVEIKQPHYYHSTLGNTALGDSITVGSSNATIATGTTFTNFSSGSYNINGSIVNL